ncbi:MAG: UrcA family protein [Sphingobium phenoxybenzoativorans]
MLTIANRSIAATAAVFAAVLSVTAVSPVRAETVRVPVSYSDLDLSSPADAATLNRRISHAADQVCGTNDRINRFRVAECRKDAIMNAKANLKVAQSAPAGIVLAAQ